MADGEHAWQGGMHGGGVRGRGGMCSRVACMVGGMYGSGACMTGGHAWGGGHVWQGVVCSRGHVWQERWPLQRAVPILLEYILVVKEVLIFLF